MTVEGAPTGGTFTLTFTPPGAMSETTVPIAFDAPAEGPNSVDHALGELSALNEGLSVSGSDGGPYRVVFGGVLGGVSQPLITATSSLVPSSASVAVATVQRGGEAYDTHYHFEYVSQGQFEEAGGAGGFAKAVSTPEVDLGSGDSAEVVGRDLPVLQAGEMYRYRLVATNTSPGDPVVRGEEQTLTVPVAAEPGVEGACPNQALRAGPSANLPDCRAYEQVTPVDKEGAQEIFDYRSGIKLAADAVVGEDGDHLMVDAPVSWGSGPDAGQSPYFFSRDPGKGWVLAAGAAQPEAGLDEYAPEVLDPDLTGFGFKASSGTLGGVESPDVEFRTGAPGGPYVTVATVPRKQAEHDGEGWVAASGDYSKLILEVEDRGLVEPRTTTKSGDDPYEYAGGSLRQVNVGIGTCGARIVDGNEQTGGNGSPHAVSSDGSRVFFEAVPGSNCSEPSHLYIRVNGAETVDLGAYRFAAANAQGTEVILEKQSGVNPGLYLYQAGSAPRFLASTGLAESKNFTVSEDLNAIYFRVGIAISRYDVPAETLSLVIDTAENAQFRPQVSRDGRYYYFASRSVAGVPGGAVVPGGGQENDHKLDGSAPTQQIYRYDSVERMIECVSCASSFAPEPKLGSSFSGDSASSGPAGTPRLVFASANGEFAFFQTPAALVSADLDGEVIPEGTEGSVEHSETENSVSGDVYEWRRDGVDGCASLQGCLALITNGRGGYLNELIGTAEEGRDVFIYTSSRLVAQDQDTAGDIYDVRVDGGFPGPAPRPTECEADACSTPLAAPVDSTPASLAFSGAGNVAPEVKPAPTKTKTKKAKTKKAKGKKKKSKPRTRGKKSSKQASNGDRRGSK